MHTQREIKDMKSLSMRRGINCDLDLRLSSSFADYYYDLMSTSDTTTSSLAGVCTNNNSMEGERGEGSSGTAGSTGSGSQQPLTIIFNGKVCVADVTELQARAILCHAATGKSELMDHERLMNNSTTSSPATTTTTTTPCSSSSSLPPPSPSLLLQSSTTTITAMNNEISMKKSLQRFLQKRKNRIQSFSSHPYNRQ